MKRYNICTCKVYTSQGQEKKSWPQVGTLIYFPESDRGPEGYKIELNMHPTQQFYVFEQKPKTVPGTDAEPDMTIDADTRAVRPASAGVARKTGGQTPAVIPPGGTRMSNDQIEYPAEEINPDDIPFS